MRFHRIALLTGILLVLLFEARPVKAWGFYGHKQINRIAVFTLPEPLFAYFRTHIDYITAHAADADKRRYAVKEEACRHYIDADYYEKSWPIDTIPTYWQEAVTCYTIDTLEAYGIVPWQVNFMVHRLREAFKSGDHARILKTAADLGHYVGDAHVPLHTTSNYNGQLSGQHGIHGLWESRLPELFANGYDLLTGTARYISHPQQAAWEAVNASFLALDSVLSIEKQLSTNFPEDQKFCLEPRGKQLVRAYSPSFSMAYHQALGGMVERRMTAAIALVGSLWYTAWIDAGQPALPAMQPLLKEQDDSQEMEKLSQGQMLGRPEMH